MKFGSVQTLSIKLYSPSEHSSVQLPTHRNLTPGMFLLVIRDLIELSYRAQLLHSCSCSLHLELGQMVFRLQGVGRAVSKFDVDSSSLNGHTPFRIFMVFQLSADGKDALDWGHRVEQLHLHKRRSQYTSFISHLSDEWLKVNPQLTY